MWSWAKVGNLAASRETTPSIARPFVGSAHRAIPFDLWLWGCAQLVSSTIAGCSSTGIGEPILGQVVLGVERCGASGSGGGDRLPVPLVDEIAAREHAVEIRSGRRMLDHDVALVVEFYLPGHELAARVVSRLR